MSCHDRIAWTASCSANVSNSAAGASQAIRRSFRKPTSNQDASRSLNSRSKARSCGSPFLILSSCARMSARNLTPSGKSLNCVKRRIRGDCSVRRNLASASSRLVKSAAWPSLSNANHALADSRNASSLTPYSNARSFRKLFRPSASRSRYTPPRRAARARAEAAPPVSERQSSICRRIRCRSSLGRAGRTLPVMRLSASCSTSIQARRNCFKPLSPKPVERSIYCLIASLFCSSPPLVLCSLTLYFLFLSSVYCC